MMLKGKVALITGASRGIGRAIAIEMAAQGAKVVLNATSQENLKEVADFIKSSGYTEPVLLPYDVSNPSEIKEAFLYIQREMKRFDIMVNNAGILEQALLGMISPALVDKTLSVNTNSVLYHMQYASRLMAKNKSGSIINLSSIIGTNGKEGLVVYGTSKAAIIGATKSAAKELAPLNIRVNAVAPGFIETDMVRQLSKDKYNERLAGIKMKRPGRPEEVAGVVLFLASDLSTYVTGQVIGVDGGMLE